MTFIPKPNSGTLFPNTRKNSDYHPDLTGNLFLDASLVRELLEGTPAGEMVKISISAWNNDGGRLGMKFSKPYVAQPVVDQKTAAAAPVDDGDVPF